MTFNPNIITAVDIKTLAKLLEKEFSLKKVFTPVDLAVYSITMDNDYLSPNGHIVKKQHLEADFTRRMEKPLTPSTAGFNYTWNDVFFARQGKNHSRGLMQWTFAKNRVFNYFKTFSKNYFQGQTTGKKKLHKPGFGKWYDDLVNVPAVNLLYMLTWDVIFFERFNCTLISENISKVGDTAIVKALSGTYVKLSFKGCDSDNSFFKNGNVYVKFSGISTFDNKTVCVYEYRSVGLLQVKKSDDNVKQIGESFFIGKIYLDCENGDLIFSDMTELLTVAMSNKQGKIVPMQKRRFVKLQKRN